jgi:hypothetical protein
MIDVRKDTNHEIYRLWDDEVAQSEEWFDTKRPPEGLSKRCVLNQRKERRNALHDPESNEMPHGH